MDEIVAVVIGLVCGGTLGLTGAGGAVIAVPLLAFGFGLPLAGAAPLALLSVALASGVATVFGLRRGIVRYRAAMLMAAMGLLIAPVGVVGARLVDEPVLWSVFSVVLAIAAGRMFTAARASSGEFGSVLAVQSEPVCPRSSETGRFVWQPVTFGVMAAIGGIAGGLSGLLGVGGGFVIVPALRWATDLDMNEAIATSLMAIALIAVGTVGVSFSMGHVFVLPRDALFLLGSLAGMGVGRWASARLPGPLVQRVFAGLMAVLAVVLMARVLLSMIGGE